MTLRFSVVIPCYNEAGYVGEAIRSLQRQDFDGAYEIVVVDNNCTDDTAQIARDLGVRVVTEAAPGVCNAREAGTVASRGEIVISADADTTYPPDWLSKIDRGFRSGDDVVLVVGPCRYADGPRWGRIFARSLFGAVHGIYRATGRTLYVTATNIAFRRDRWTGYDVHLTQGGDELDLLRRMRHEGRVVYDHTNPTFTSGRRFTRGFFYNVVVCLFVFYLSAYALNRVTGRRVIGSAPAFRDSRRRRPSGRLRLAAAGLVATLVLFAFQQPRAYLAEKAGNAVSYVQQHTDLDDIRW
ncbi:glycosyltransferase family 2 protein [Actinoplanes sp. KI2]|uniref:glycosyltransferase family 2 protein n=1 Tax=Actinoplanes sp. KI2 TaxID=2983315 RepID=UPI0021D591C3|nr:glycosyltransferase family 2 protein [Actinoplanes sp. KI2]MCU7724268.1 glycosyltransferase family 2 protein [Actinoplanes sp. KI2]